MYEPSYEESRQIMQNTAWGAQVAHFIRLYAPEDRRQRFEFERDFYALIQQTFHTAQEPLAKHMAAAMSLAPLILPVKEKA